jgi:hypothetical protein
MTQTATRALPRAVGLRVVTPLAGCCHCSSRVLSFLICCVADATGPGARGLRQLDRCGGVLADTWTDLLLLHHESAANANLHKVVTGNAKHVYIYAVQ